MAIDSISTGPVDPTQVELKDSVAVEYWLDRLGTTRERLDEAIRSVGTAADDVEQWLARHQPVSTPAGPTVE